MGSEPPPGAQEPGRASRPNAGRGVLSSLLSLLSPGLFHGVDWFVLSGCHARCEGLIEGRSSEGRAWGRTARVFWGGSKQLARGNWKAGAGDRCARGSPARGKEQLVAAASPLLFPDSTPPPGTRGGRKRRPSPPCRPPEPGRPQIESGGERRDDHSLRRRAEGQKPGYYTY